MHSHVQIGSKSLKNNEVVFKIYHIIPGSGKDTRQPRVASYTAATIAVYASYRRTYGETRVTYQEYTFELGSINFLPKLLTSACTTHFVQQGGPVD